MKILIFMPSLAGGGAERTIVNLANEFIKKDHHVEILIGKELEDELRSSKYRDLLSERVNLVELSVSATAKNAIKLLISVRQQIKSRKPDLVFTTRLPANLLVMFATMGIRNRFKVIIRESVFRSSTIKNKFKQYLIGSIYSQSDAIVALSHGVSKDLVDNFQVSPSLVKTIYNPIDLKFINRKIRPTQFNRNILEPKFVFLGRFDEQKSPLEAILAFEVIEKKYAAASLCMYGVGPMVAEVLDYIKFRSSAKNIKYFGFTHDPFEKLQDSDFLLMPSKYEGFGHVIAEALACNCIPIVYDCPHGPSEILVGQLKELLVPVGDWQGLGNTAMGLLEAPSKFSKLQALGNEVVKKYGSDIIADEYLKFFEKVRKV